MPQTSSPFGLKLVKSQGGAVTLAPERLVLIAGGLGPTYPTAGLLYIPTSSAAASSTAAPGLVAGGTSIYANDPIYYDGVGGIAATIGGAPAGITGATIGTFQGVEYSDSSGKRTVSNKWLAGTSAFPGSEVWFWHTTASTADTIFEIQSSGGTLTQAAIGATYGITFPGTPNSVTGFSVAALDASGPSINGSLQVYALAYDPNLGTTGANYGYAPGIPTAGNNNWGDPFVNVYVKLARGQFTQQVVGF